MLKSKKVFVGSFLEACVNKRLADERNERSGEFKGVKERDEVFVSRGPGKATSNEIGISP